MGCPGLSNSIQMTTENNPGDCKTAFKNSQHYAVLEEKGISRMEDTVLLAQEEVAVVRIKQPHIQFLSGEQNRGDQGIVEVSHGTSMPE